MKTYLLTVLSFLLIDAIWIVGVAGPLYSRHLPNDFLADPVRLLPSGLFYALFTWALWYLYIRRHKLINKSLLIDVFIFGTVAYSTYALTNQAIIADWNWYVTLPDMLWGGILSTLITLLVFKTNSLLSSS